MISMKRSCNTILQNIVVNNVLQLETFAIRTCILVSLVLRVFIA